MSDNQPSTTDSTDSSQTLQRLGNIILTVGNVECRQWDDITIDSDIGIPADGWSFAWLDKTIANLPDSVKSGAVCQIDIENKEVRETILVGVIDKIQQTVSRGQISVVISGRDLAGQLLDTSAPITQEQNMTLFEIIRQFVIQDGDLQSLPWRVRPQDDNWLRAKTGIQDGESVWDAINKAAEASGQYVWMSSDGAICIGNPFDVEQPKEPPVFILNEDNAHNNCLNLSYSEDLSNAYSIVEAIGQDDKGKNFRGAAHDDRMTIKRRKILSDSRAENQSDAMQYAQKALRDSWLDAYECSILTNHWGWMSKVFATGWRVKVISTIMPRASGDWVIYGRTLKLTRNEGKTTELRLKKYQEWMQPVQHVDLIKDAKPKKSKKQTTIKSKRSKS